MHSKFDEDSLLCTHIINMELGWIEIFVSATITILLVFIGCLVLGLQISSIKSTISNNQASMTQTISETVSNIKKTTDDQGIKLYNLGQSQSTDHNRLLQMQLDQIKQQQQFQATEANVKVSQEKLTQMQNGKTPFTSLKVGPTSFASTDAGNFKIDTGSSSNLNLTAKNLNMSNDSCINLGNQTICNTQGNLNMSGNFNTSNILLGGNISLTSQEDQLYIKDSSGHSKGMAVNGIRQTQPGSMIDYNGYGLGEYDNGIIRTYAPASSGSMISMSFASPTGFRDVVQVTESGVQDKVTVQGDMNVTGTISNPDFQQAMSKINIALAQIAVLQESLGKS